MSLEGISLSRWPHPTAVADPHLGDIEKRSELDYDYSLEGVLQGVAVELPELDAELPAGIQKHAAMRFGTDEELPLVTSKNIWRHPNAHPLVLTLLLLDRYKQEYLSWEPETLRGMLKRDNILISDSVWTKILAARVILMSPAPWRQWEQFHWVVTGLGGKPPNFVFMERPEIGFVMAGVDTMKMVDRKRPFAEDITKFTAAVLRDRGIAYAPPPLQFAQEELNDRRIICGHCGTRERDDHDIKCVACGSKDLKRLPGAFESLRDQTKTIFEARRKMPLDQAVDGLGVDAAAESAYKLLVHNEYRNQVRAQLLEQLRMLKAG